MRHLLEEGKMRIYRTPQRAAFTLIELLVVVSIIGILIALLLPAVNIIIIRGIEATCRGDMQEISNAHGAFRTEFGVKYIPSRIVLREQGDYNLADPLEKASSIYLQQVFGKRLTYPVDWNGNGTIDAGATVLNGEESIVFFLGGIPGANGATQGFSTNPANPSDMTSPTKRGPFMDFKAGRLVATNGRYYSYTDAFKTGRYYVYLSSGPRSNDYSSDSGQSVQPFLSGAGKYMNPSGFQLICAGRNGRFGPGGGAWSVTDGYGASNPDGWDDLSNFTTGNLRAGQ